MALLDLFIASSIPVLKVLLVTGLGSYLALDQIGILGDDARKHLNNIIFFVFNPALVSSNLAKKITYESMNHKSSTHLRGLVIGCCAAGNLGNLLFIIIPTACKERTSTFGDADVCHENGMAYASLSMAIGAIYLWGYVYNIVRVSSSTLSRESSSSPSGGSWTEPLLSSSNLPQDRFENKPPVSVAAKIKKKLELLVEKMNLKRLFAPSTTAAIAGFVVGLVPQIRKLLIGDAAPLRVIQDTALLLGGWVIATLITLIHGNADASCLSLQDGAIPAITLIMGGNLIKGLKGSGIQKPVIFGILAVRYVALPLTGIAVVKGALRFGLIHDDPLYLFVLLLQFSLPPAMNIGTMTQLFGVGESECSVIMLWCYTLASVSLTLWSTVFLWLVS
ncbi:UNVERIFIED_CONTAM: protein PIN-LIKES 1 [Sesamum angustifolium]|uniref:Protein PIN-LIKES 1 n=1 Tax=Sesamum angustifolium TaxID=2727405 RepID=A0AAW2L5B1_9LAMI